MTQRGKSESRPAILRLTESGEPDQAMGPRGIQVLPNTRIGYLTSALSSSDGHITVVGRFETSKSRYNLAVSQYRPQR